MLKEEFLRATKCMLKFWVMILCECARVHVVLTCVLGGGWQVSCRQRMTSGGHLRLQGGLQPDGVADGLLMSHAHLMGCLCHMLSPGFTTQSKNFGLDSARRTNAWRACEQSLSAEVWVQLPLPMPSGVWGRVHSTGVGVLLGGRHSCTPWTRCMWALRTSRLQCHTATSAHGKRAVGSVWARADPLCVCVRVCVCAYVCVRRSRSTCAPWPAPVRGCMCVCAGQGADD